jgi:hypothetical protein
MKRVPVAAKGGVELEWPSPAETRSLLYWLARFLGDYQAVKSIYVALGFKGGVLGG